jgi:hypothetical protein
VSKSRDAHLRQEHFWAGAQVRRAISKIIKRYGPMDRADAIRLACVVVGESDGPTLSAPPLIDRPQVGRPKGQPRGR